MSVSSAESSTPLPDTHLIGPDYVIITRIAPENAPFVTCSTYSAADFASNMKRPPGNRAASSLGRIVPTEAKPSELSGEILWLAKWRVKV